VDVRFADDNDGELYVLTKSDGMIRKVVSARAANAPASTATASTPSGGQIKRGVPSTMMPGFTGQLTDDDVWNVVNYVRSLQPGK
jgi:hypothetical protein